MGLRRPLGKLEQAVAVGRRASEWEASHQGMRLTHFDTDGAPRMVDVGQKDVSDRVAVARGRVVMRPETLDMIRAQVEGRATELAKGDVVGVARLAGIMAAKRTAELIPLCHPLPLDAIDLRIAPAVDEAALEIEASVRTSARTGVEMEALTAVSVAALTVYDMCKAVDRGMALRDIRLVRKSGGASGTFVADEESAARTDR
jgi:cyclic pyranopterin phosphate synthase